MAKNKNYLKNTSPYHIFNQRQTILTTKDKQDTKNQPL